MDKHLSIGVDLGGTHIKAVLMETGGKILERLSMDTGDSEENEDLSQVWKNRIHQIVKQLQKQAGKPLAVGISAPGLPNDAHNAICYMPGRLQGLEFFDWSTFLPAPRVRVLNDAVSALLAERNFGAAQGYQHVLMLTLGTGVGGGLLIHGKPYIGKLNRAGHVGHISMNPDAPRGIMNIPGTLEYFVGNATIKERSLGRFNSTRELVEAYENKDPFATQVWMDSLKKLALGISSLINVISPQLVILGGGIIQAGPSLFDPLQALMAEYEWRPGGVSTPIKSAQMKEYAGAVGAAVFALEE